MRLTVGIAVLWTFTLTLAGPVTQTDWSAGGQVDGPVLHWNGSFADQSGVAWRSVEGQIALAGSQRGQAVRVVVDENADLPRGAAAGDFDGDGRTDIVIGDPVTDPFNPIGAIYWWHAEANGSWTRGYVSQTYYGINFLTTADVDGDGDTDIVAAAYYGAIDPPPPPPEYRNGRYTWFENVNGEGSAWDEHTVGELYWGAEYIDVGDFDGDGDLDFVGASYLTRGVYEQSNDITWFENLDGQGDAWEAHGVSAVYNNGYEAHFVDLDGDDDLDILATHADRISWWENRTGTGDDLVEHVITASLMNVGYVNAGDIDNDGDLDIVGSTYSTSSLFWWENSNGLGTAWLQHVIGAHPKGEQVELVDIEGDGDLDIVGDRRPSGTYGALTIYTNVDGNGFTWSGRTVSIESNTDYSIAIADADSDGKVDVLVASEDYYRALGKQVSFFNLSTFGSSGSLTSSILDGGTMPGWGVMAWDADTHNGTSLAVAIRASDDANDLGSFVQVPTSGTDLATLVNSNARYVQYRLTLSGGSEVSPVIRELGIARVGGGNGLILAGPPQATAGRSLELGVQSDQIGARVVFAGAVSTGRTPIPPCPGVTAGLASPMRLGASFINASGEARRSVRIPLAAKGRMLYFQALDASDCVVSNVVAIPVD